MHLWRWIWVVCLVSSLRVRLILRFRNGFWSIGGTCLVCRERRSSLLECFGICTELDVLPMCLRNKRLEAWRHRWNLRTRVGHLNLYHIGAQTYSHRLCDSTSQTTEALPATTALSAIPTTSNQSSSTHPTNWSPYAMPNWQQRLLSPVHAQSYL